MTNKNQRVIEDLISRASGKTDGRKIGLILQGGGMRGAFGGGVMIELERLGLKDAFDFIYSSSSGSFSGAYLLAGEAEKGTSIYWEELSGRRFIQPWKPWKLMNLDYFCDEVVKDIKPLNLEKIQEADTIFKIYLSEPKSGETHAITNKENIDLLKALKATCSFPGCYYPLVRINGKKYFDGNAVKVFPFEQAKHDGCTEVLVVATVTEEYRDKTHGKFSSFFLYNTLFFPLGKRFKERYGKRAKEYNEELDYVFGRKQIDGMKIYTIAPDYMIPNAETNSKKLKDFAKHGIKKAKEAFNLST